MRPENYGSLFGVSVLLIITNVALIGLGGWPLALYIDVLFSIPIALIAYKVHTLNKENKYIEHFEIDKPPYESELRYVSDRQMVNDYSKDNNEELIDTKDDLVQNPNMELDSTSKVDSNQMSEASEGRVLTKSKKKLH